MKRFNGVWWLEMLGLFALALLLAGASRQINPPSHDSEGIDQDLPEVIMEPAGIDVIRDVHQFGAVFIDVRAPEQFAAERIPRALNWPVDSTDPPPDAVKQAQLVVVYGQGADIGPAVVVGEKLKSVVRAQLFIFLEGLEGWRAAGLELERD